MDVHTATLTIEDRPYVTRVREGAALDEPLKLKLTHDVIVDASRDIA